MTAAPARRSRLTTTRPRSSRGPAGARTRGSSAAAPPTPSRLAFAVVHHTAGGVPTTPAKSAAMVRGIEVYHVRSNGWNDIGYNFLVDPFGQIFEGRKRRDRRAT